MEIFHIAKDGIKMANFDEYERDYLENLKNQVNSVSKREKLNSLVEPLTSFDYVVLGLIRNGVSKLQTMFKRMPKVSSGKITSSFNKLMKRGYLKNHPDDSWIDRNFNPTCVMSDKGKEEIEKKIDELREKWDKLVLLYEKKDKEKLREGMNSNRMNFPLMMMMGFAGGMMMGNMLGMNNMMMGDFMAEVDYAYDMGYADGAGFGDGAMPAEGGDFGGDGGRIHGRWYGSGILDDFGS